jgi:putative hydrolase of the HAD superfamily
MSNQEGNKKITTLIFDIDDTLYDVSTGFTASRNGEAVQRFMMEYLDFPDLESANNIWEEYFVRYHSTAKALVVAEEEGRLPPPKDPTKAKSPRFDPNDLAEYWATNLNFERLGSPKKRLLQDLKDCKLTHVAFTNGPRKYAKRVLQELGLFEVFGEERLFAVDDVLPSCKPDKEAFEKIFLKLGVTAEECVMFEDSMKNIRRAKELNMKTVLVTGEGRMRKNRANTTSSSAADAAEATKPGDVPVEDDPAVDVAIETVEELRNVLPGLWDSPAVFALTR